jgi:type IV secretory pathway TrbL component
MLFFALNYLPCAFNSTEIIIITTLILGGFGRFFIAYTTAWTQEVENVGNTFSRK